MTKSAKAFTQSDAERFVKTLLEEVFPNGSVERVEDFYHPDVVGHFQEGILHFNDIKDRIRALKNNLRDIRFTVEWVTVIDDLVPFTCRQSWVSKSDQRFYDTLVFGIYRIRAGKVAEAWLQLDTKVDPYQQVNQHFVQSMLPFEAQQQNKRDFLRRLSRLLLSSESTVIKLSKQERESLFYYFNGFSSKEAGREMNISPRTFESYITHIKDYFGCRTKHELRKHLKL